MGPLANEGDFEARLGRDIQDLERARVLALLTDASAKVRRVSGQTISRATTTHRFNPRHTPNGYGIVLNQWPVVSVDTVDGDFTWFAGSNFLATWTPLTVTYTHGYDPVPDDIVAVVCQIAARAFGTKPDTSGVSSESLGAYSYSIGAAAAAGPLGMLADEREIVLAYRLPTQPISMVANCTTRFRYLDAWYLEPGWR